MTLITYNRDRKDVPQSIKFLIKSRKMAARGPRVKSKNSVAVQTYTTIIQTEGEKKS